MAQERHRKKLKAVIVTLAERRNRLYLAMPIARKTAALTRDAITTLLATFKTHVHTITYDNGRAFAMHSQLLNVNYLVRSASINLSA